MPAARSSASPACGELLPRRVGLGPLVLLFVQLLEVDQRVLVLGIEPQHLVERLERAIDEAAALVVEARGRAARRRARACAARGRCSSAWCTWMARPTWPFSRYRLPRIRWISSASPASLRGLRQLLDRQIDLVGDEEVQAEHVVRRLARAAPIDPAAVPQLVALPRLADGEARPAARRSADEQRTVGRPSRLGALDVVARRRRPSGPGRAARARSARAPRRGRPRACADPVHARAHLGGRVGRRGRQPDARRAPAGRAGRRPCRRPRRRSSPASPQDLLVRVRACCATPWTTMRMPSCAARCAVAPDGRADRSPTVRPGALRPARSRCRRGCGTACARCRRRASGPCRRSARRRRRTASSRTADGLRLH